MKVDAFLIVFAIIAIFLSSAFPASGESAFGLSAFPNFFAWAIIICAVCDMAIEVFTKKKSKSDSAADSSDEPQEESPYFSKFLAISAAYLLLMPLIGFVLTTGVYYAAILWVFGYSHYARALASGLAFAIIMYAVFGFFMNVALPTGFLN